ncbi:hypothetical protein TVAG_155990 [Trichomonas vaginalis G3]|uniref:Uncharacterized protein n=1 Tax=Trichomonas vaginalis (strain ATCC PRA-98 / G3) TaxID=412133 RepID=A2FPC2_TRIV3|nr:SCA1 complex scaffold protein SCAA family [Trichomonas vaginalis G3]EAX93235.1 hypothetical protein TVAG_155990 [Trichomonas vaginalis G3]KAI5516851.1 SCA1 complex scaffold protein SCAA family [Trichomonas vaginalis G3]|eukprot:XP_001306165.1 hypothetical protein [Trichomonas vaginalis G3]
MKSFPTSLGKDYTFQEPSYETALPDRPPDSQTNLVFIDRNGQSLNVYGQPIPPPEILLTVNKLSKLPYPDADSEEEYRKMVLQWQNSMLNVSKSVFLPVPMGLNYQRPVKPHVPTPMEKVKGSLEERTARKSFNVKTTALYPQNYMVLLDAVLNENEITTPEFEIKGPRDQVIPVANHFGKEKTWSSQLIPLKPNPQLYLTYQEYADAMYNWIHNISKNCVIPPNPSQLQSIIGIELERRQIVKKNLKRGRAQRTNSDFYSIITLPATGLIDYEDEPGSILSDVSEQIGSFLTSDLMRIKSKVDEPSGLRVISDQLIGLHHLYVTSFIDNSRNKYQMHFQTPSNLPPIPGLIKEWSEYGLEQPFVHKLVPLAIVQSSYAHELANSPQYTYIPEISTSHQIFYLCKTFQQTQLRYELFNKILVVLSNKEIFDSITSDISILYEIYKLFHEFTTQICDIPDYVVEPECNYLLFDFYSKLLNFYIVRQMHEYYKGRDKQLARSFKVHTEGLHSMISNFLHASYREIREIIENSVEEHPHMCTQIIFMVLSLDNQLLSFLSQIDFRVIPIIMAISKQSPKDFRFLQLHIFRSLPMATFIIQQLSYLNYDQNCLLYQTPPEFMSFLSSILVQKLSKEAISPNVDWTLSFLTDILNHANGLLTQTQCDFIYAISIFIQNRMWAHQQQKHWEMMLPQILSTLIAFMAISTETQTKLSLLKAFRRLLWHPCAGKMLTSRLVVMQITPFLKDPAVSISGIRTIKLIVINHPNFLEAIVNNPKELQKLGEAMFLTNEDAYVEIFKFIKLATSMPWYTGYKSQYQKYFHQFLLASHFRIDAAKSKVESKAQKKQKEVFKDFVMYLKKNPHVNQMLSNIDVQLSGARK